MDLCDATLAGAVRPGDGGPFLLVYRRVEELANTNQELHATLLLAEIANAIVSKAPHHALTLLIEEFNRIPRTAMIDDEIRCFALDLPVLPTLLVEHHLPLTMSKCRTNVRCNNCHEATSAC